MREMKDSGIEWIGEIPAKWTRKKLNYLSERIGDGLHGTPVFDSDGCYYFINGNNIGKKEIQIKNNTDTVNFDEYRKYMQPLNNNTILISLNGTIGCVSNYNNEKIILGKSAGYITLFPLINREFIRYYLQSDASQIAFVLSFSGTTINNLSLATLRNLSVLLPDNDEQNRIVSFLDNKCAEIDSLISDIQSQIEALEEYKRSVITEAVTKGLDPDVEMRDSGVQWIGMMPTHWDCQRGKYILRYVQKPVRDDDGVITCFRDGEVTLRSNRREEGFTMADKEIGYQGIDVGDLVVHGMDGFAGAIGISDSRGKASPVLNVLDTEQDKRYIMYYLRSMAYNDVFVALATGIRVRSCDLRWNKLAELFYPLPPVEEQKVIVEHIDSVLERTNAIISEKKQQIETIEEYKKSLIYEYVTGKKEVKL